MKVVQILEKKGDSVIVLDRAKTGHDAVALLGKRNVGAAVVTENGRDNVCGIVSERDIVRYIARYGTSILDQGVSDIMTHDVFTCQREDTIDSILSLMTEKRIRHLPVVAQGQLVGVISIGDVVKAKIAETEQEAEALRAYITTA